MTKLEIRILDGGTSREYASVKQIVNGFQMTDIRREERMRHAVLATLLVLVPVCTSPAMSAEWYEGGTLHKPTLGEWRSASSKNRLATAADFTAAVLKDTSTFDEAFRRTPAMLNCINEVAEDPRLDTQETATIAAFCAVLLGW